MEEQKLITFVDQTGRTIIGIRDGETATTIVVKNPAILYVQPTNDGKLNVQTIPLYFKEFISDKNKNNGTRWEYVKVNITVGLDVDNDSRLVNQYTQLFAAAPAVPIANVPSEPKVVKLFDAVS